MSAGPLQPTRSASVGRVLFATLWLGVALQVVGQVIDLRWHATHEEFETAGDQLRAHWLLWIGAVATLGASAVGARRPDLRNRGLTAAVAAGVLYAAASIWHFVEHANGADPEAAHVVILVAKIGWLGAVIWATLLWWRGAARPTR